MKKGFLIILILMTLVLTACGDRKALNQTENARIPQSSGAPDVERDVSVTENESLALKSFSFVTPDEVVLKGYYDNTCDTVPKWICDTAKVSETGFSDYRTDVPEEGNIQVLFGNCWYLVPAEYCGEMPEKKLENECSIELELYETVKSAWEAPDRFTFASTDMNDRRCDESLFADFDVTAFYIWNPDLENTVRNLGVFQKIYEKYCSYMSVIGVYPEDNEAEAAEIIQDKGITFLNIRDSQDFDRFRIEGSPITFFVDSNGNVLPVTEDEADTVYRILLTDTVNSFLNDYNTAEPSSQEEPEGLVQYYINLSEDEELFEQFIDSLLDEIYRPNRNVFAADWTRSLLEWIVSERLPESDMTEIEIAGRKEIEISGNGSLESLTDVAIEGLDDEIDGLFSVSIDGIEVPSGYCTVSPAEGGKMHITVSKDYIASLGGGQHLLDVYFCNSSLDQARFTKGMQ